MMSGRIVRGGSVALLAILLTGCPDNFSGSRSTSDTATVVLVAPTGFVGVAQDATTLQLSWLDNSTGESEYRIEISDIPMVTIGDVLDFFSVPANSTSAVYTTNPNTTYYVRVAAVNTPLGLRSPYSVEIIVTTPNPPATPPGFNATLIAPNQIQVIWGNVAAETSFTIERSVDGGPFTPLVTLPADTTIHTDTALATDTDFCYRVFASNGNGDGVPSPPACQQTPTTSVTITRNVTANVDGRFTSMAVDPATGEEHISHYDVIAMNTLYTTYSTVPGFATVTADSGTGAGDNVGFDGTSIDRDAAGAVHVATSRNDFLGTDLRHVTNASGPLVATTIDPVLDAGDLPNVKVSPFDDSLHVLYVHNDPVTFIPTVKHASNVGVGWTLEDVFSGTLVTTLSLDIDGAGNLHVVFLDRSGGGSTYNLTYGIKIGAGSWVFTIINTDLGFKKGSIAVNAAGFPHVAFNATQGGGSVEALHHATNESGTWMTEVVDQDAARSIGRHNSIAIDQVTGRIHVAYQAGNLDLHYARKDPAGAWVRRVLDTVGDVGQYTSIAVDAAGNIHLSYEDASLGDLKRLSGAP